VLVDAVLKALGRSEDLRGETVLVTAGGTREAIDPVRFLGNRSSGKMGYALATAAIARGAKVILVSAPTALAAPSGCEFVKVTTAAEMRAAVLEHLPRATAVIGAAAVSDFRPITVAAEKLRRSGPLTLELEPTADILAEVAVKRAAGTLVVAFAAETDSAAALESGRAKLARKGADAIVINDVSLPGLGFDSERNAATILTHDGDRDVPPTSKATLAEAILDELAGLRSRAEQRLQTV
jgi:phosphopantothenoylcysteine decarboxylase/phosphopantothenate--cysteine ligase